MAVTLLQTSDRNARTTPPRLPSFRSVLMEQVRVTGRAVRGAALLFATLLALLTLWVALQSASKVTVINVNAWPTQLPGIMGALLPVAVWARDERFGPSFLWTLPVDRSRHAATKVMAGWMWLIGGVGLFVCWLPLVTFATGGRALPPETLHVLVSPNNALDSLDAAALRSVRWVPGSLIWAVPFTAATACYLLASALVLGSRYPGRWVVGAVLAYALSRFTSQAIGTGWMADAPARLVGLLVEGRYGLDAVLTARLETLAFQGHLKSGEEIMVWSAVPHLADWGLATLLWTGAGLLALWAAASRHRERRRA
jgi:hypothetical protein